MRTNTFNPYKNNNSKKYQCWPDVQSMFKFKNIVYLLNLIVFLLGIQIQSTNVYIFTKTNHIARIYYIKFNSTPTLNIFILV